MLKKSVIAIVIGLVMMMASIWLVNDQSYAAVPPRLKAESGETVTVSKGQKAVLEYSWLPQFCLRPVNMT